MISAVNAGPRGWDEYQPSRRDPLATTYTVPIFSCSNAFQGDSDCLDFIKATPFALPGHCLYLHRIHTGQAADTLLVQFDRCARFSGTFRLSCEFRSSFPQLCCNPVHIDVIVMLHEACPARSGDSRGNLV